MTRRPEPPRLAITFLYYRDLPRAMRFYEEALGLPLAIDQGWCKIYRLADGAHLGLVDERRGMNAWAETKPVQICLRVADVDAWRAWLAEAGVAGLSETVENAKLGIRAFVFRDPEGYQIEIQTPIRDGA